MTEATEFPKISTAGKQELRNLITSEENGFGFEEPRMEMNIKSLTTTKKYSTANKNISKQYYYLKTVLTSTVIGFLAFNMSYQVNLNHTA